VPPRLIHKGIYEAFKVVITPPEVHVVFHVFLEGAFRNDPDPFSYMQFMDSLGATFFRYQQLLDFDCTVENALRLMERVKDTTDPMSRVFPNITNAEHLLSFMNAIYRNDVGFKLFQNIQSIGDLIPMMNELADILAQANRGATADLLSDERANDLSDNDGATKAVADNTEDGRPLIEAILY